MGPEEGFLGCLAEAYLMAESNPASTDLAASALGALSMAACNAFRIASPLTFNGKHNYSE